MEYIIEGDTERFNNCLVYTCGRDKKNAERILNRMLTNPCEADLKILETHKNLRVAPVEDVNCWWNNPFLAN